MNEKLQHQLVEVLANIQASVARASDFTVQQLPDVAQQYVMYGRLSETLATVGWLGILVVGCVVFYRTAREKNAFYGPLVGGLAAFFGVLGVGANANHLIMVWVAPKIYLLHGLATLLK